MPLTQVPVAMFETDMATQSELDGVSTTVGTKANDNAVVKLTGDQTVAGIKTFSSQPVLPQKLTLGTEVAATSGTAIDFTGIPSWVNRITLGLRNVSTNGSGIPQVQLGTSGGFVTTGYSSMAMAVAGTSAAASAGTTGLVMSTGGGAANSYSGLVTIVRVNSTTWAMTSCTSGASNGGASAAGSITLGGQLDRVRFTTTAADTFDAGSINILYE